MGSSLVVAVSWPQLQDAVLVVMCAEWSDSFDA